VQQPAAAGQLPGHAAQPPGAAAGRQAAAGSAAGATHSVGAGAWAHLSQHTMCKRGWHLEETAIHKQLGHPFKHACL
jgi:hypothetical protein